MGKRPPNARAQHTLPPRPHTLPGASGDEPVATVLTGDRARLWNDVRSRWSLDTASEALLKNGCEALERAAQLAAQVNEQGATFKDRFGAVRVNPAAQLERDFRGLASRTLQQLTARLEG
jgi:hypothetical protein